MRLPLPAAMIMDAVFMLCQNLLFFARKGMAVIEKRFSLYTVSQYAVCTGKIDFMQALTSQNRPVVPACDAFLFFSYLPLPSSINGRNLPPVLF
jgi:hypothetical protein